MHFGLLCIHIDRKGKGLQNLLTPYLRNSLSFFLAIGYKIYFTFLKLGVAVKNVVRF